ncbi:MAG: hypothetical protein ISS82_01755 [Nanoarchaeota archaeon]|nr:hypothetical protein [Nanoarchaeota archaeon]
MVFFFGNKDVKLNKGRLVMPDFTGFSPIYESQNPQIYGVKVCEGDFKYLALGFEEDWERRTTELKNHNYGIARIWVGATNSLELKASEIVDQLKEIYLPPDYLRHIDVYKDSKVKLIGNVSFLEVWSEKGFEEFREKCRKSEPIKFSEGHAPF